MLELLKDLADVLEKHKGGLLYTARDDGIHVMIGTDYVNKICIGWPSEGNVTGLRTIIERNTPT